MIRYVIEGMRYFSFKTLIHCLSISSQNTSGQVSWRVSKNYDFFKLKKKKKVPKSASMPIALKLIQEDISQHELTGIMILERKVVYNGDDIHCNSS